MASVIQAGTASNTALTLSSDTSGELQLKTNSGSTTALTLTTGGNINIPTTGARITGDFSNATDANRVLFQTNTTNGTTFVAVIPNGTSTNSSFRAYSNSDPTNASWIQISATSTDMRLNSNASGSGTALPLTMYTGGSERLRIDTSGNVGIGTSSPSSRLHVKGTDVRLNFETNTGATSYIQQLSASPYNVSFYNQNAGSLIFGTSDTERMRIDSSGNVSIGATSSSSQAFRVSKTAFPNVPSGFYCSDGDGAGAYQYAITRVDATNGRGFRFENTLDGSNLPYYTISTGTAASTIAGMTWTERMRITSGGDVLFGSTSTTANNTCFIQANAFGNGLGFGTTFDGRGAVTFAYTGTEVGRITINTTSTTYSTSSDYRLKENIVPMTGALATVAQLKPCTYTWKSNGSAGQGFIAHELQAIMPDCVTGKKDEVDEEGKPVYQGVDTSFLVATLTAAIQEQQAMIEELKQEVDKLKGV